MKKLKKSINKKEGKKEKRKKERKKERKILVKLQAYFSSNTLLIPKQDLLMVYIPTYLIKQ